MDEHNNRTLDDVRKCAGKLTRVHGLAAVLHLLKRYNATRICEVPEKHYANFVGRCEWQLSKTD
jgi:hypothetical protein